MLSSDKIVMRASFEGEEQGNSGLRLEALGGAARQCGEACRVVGKDGGSEGAGRTK